MSITNSNSTLKNIQSFVSQVVADQVEIEAKGPVSYVADIAQVVSVDSDTVTFPMVFPFGALEKGDDQAVVEQVDLASVTSAIEVYKKAVEIDKFKASDDKLGVYDRAIRLLASAGTRTYSRLLDAQILAATSSTKTVTGEALLSSSQTWGRGQTAQSNLLTSTALTDVNLNSSIAAFVGFKDAKGEIIGRMPDTLIVPPQLRSTALKLVTAEYDNYGATNVNNGLLKVVVAPGLASQATSWYLLDSELSPFFIFEREAVYSEVDDSMLVSADKYFAYVKARLAGGYGLWSSVLKATA